MSQTGGMGLNGAAVARAADAMLQAMGNDEVNLVLPLVTMPNDPSAQLGLVDPGVQQVTLAPAAVRTLTASGSGPRRRLEFLISASAVAAQVVAQNAASADALFDGALGLFYAGEMFHIDSVTPEYFGGAACLYKIEAVE